MPRVVGVRFRRAGKTYYFDPAAHRVAVGDKVIVETARGLEIGVVITAEKELMKVKLSTVEKSMRIATEAIRQAGRKPPREGTPLKSAGPINRHGLNMKLVGVEYTDAARSFCLPLKRVDFRAGKDGFTF